MTAFGDYADFDIPLPDTLFDEGLASDQRPSKCYLSRSRYDELLEQAKRVDGEPDWLAGIEVVADERLPEDCVILADRRGRIVNIFKLGDYGSDR